MRLQTALRTVFPPECLACSAQVEKEFALCPSCWAQTPFILGASCDLCGVALPGHSDQGEELICDECLKTPRPWDHGRAVFAYDGAARRLVLGLKHGDRTDIARAAGPWMARAAGTLCDEDTLIVPVPLFRARLWRRRYNQSALLAQSLAAMSGAEVMVDALVRHRATPSLDGKSRSERHALLNGAIRANPRRDLHGRAMLLVDDVMTTGATLSESTGALRDAGAANVSVLVLARAGKEP